MSGPDLPYLPDSTLYLSPDCPAVLSFQTVTFEDISNSAEQLLTHRSQQRKVFTSTLLPCKSDDITLSEIMNGV